MLIGVNYGKFVEYKRFGSYESSSSNSSRSVSPSDIDTNLVSLCLCPDRFVMALSNSNQSFFCEKAMNIDSICLEEDLVKSFLLVLEVSNIENRAYMLLETQNLVVYD